MRRCERCGATYDWERSSSRWLKMTVCSIQCELGLLGFTLEAALAMERRVPEALTEEEIDKLRDLWLVRA